MAILDILLATVGAAMAATVLVCALGVVVEIAENNTEIWLGRDDEYDDQ